MINWTPITLLKPEWFVDPKTKWRQRAFKVWSQEFEWRQDDWGGYKDVLKTPEQTWKDGYGDCEDYAFVAASWALSRGRRGVGVGACFNGYSLEHMIAYDSKRVYSSGDVMEMDVDEYIQNSEYDNVVRRPL